MDLVMIKYRTNCSNYCYGLLRICRRKGCNAV